MKKPIKKPTQVGPQAAVSRMLNDIMLRVAPPNSLEAEVGLMSCMMEDNSLLDLPHKDQWFYHEQNRSTYHLMLKMRKEGLIVEFVSLSKRLYLDGVFREEGPAIAFASELTDRNHGPPSKALYKQYLDILIGCDLGRSVIQGGAEMITSGYSSDATQIASQAIAQLGVISEAAGIHNKSVSMGDHLEEWMDTWTDIFKGRKESAMPTRWPCFNRKCMGLRPGYIVISGPRGSGKSCAGQNLQTDACLVHGKAGICFNFEMPVRMTINRIISDIGNIEGAHLFCPDLTKPPKEIIKKITKCVELIKASKLEVIHDVSMSMDEVSMRAKAHKAKHGSCVTLIDYVQLVCPPKIGRDSNREQEVAQNSAILRRLSKEIDEPVIALSQLNAQGQTRESASIESDADFVARVERYKNPDGSTKEGGILVFKNRSGEEGFVLPLEFQGSYYRFKCKEQVEEDQIPC